MTPKRNHLAVTGLVVCLAGFYGPAVARSAPYPVDPIPMRVEIDVGAQRYFVGENFPITVRIANPNPYDVYLGGFEFGALEPHMELLFPGEEEFHDFSRGGTVDVIGGPPVLIPARGDIEHRRLVYSDTRLDGGHWVLMPPGTYRLRMKRSVGAVTPGEPGRYTGVDWASDLVAFTLTMPAGPDLAALEFLQNKVGELSEHQRDPERGFSSARFHLGVYPRFLDRFPESVYAPEIRWRLAKLLRGELGSSRIPEKDVPQMVGLFAECLTFCLDEGGAYAQYFLRWDMQEGGNRTMQLARSRKWSDLLKRIVKELDDKYPDDKPAILRRRFVVALETESKEAARRVAATLTKRFPDSEYTRAVNDALFWRDHKNGSE